jgi:hypothetical protein
MSNYFSLQPLGWGTEDVEQFHSFFYRFAAVHATTMISMARHLAEWWARDTGESIVLNDVFLYKANRLPLCGYGDAVANYVRVVSAAAHQAELYRTTLLPLRDAADAVAHGALRKGRAWCPACMYWADRRGEPYYDKLLWAIAAVERCPIHQVALQSTCHRCGNHQLAYHPKAGMACCAKCAQPLVQSPETWTRATRPSFGEGDCRALIEAIADGSLRATVPKAFSIFCEELRSFAGPLVAYEKGATLRSASRTWRKLARPTLSTMLKRCHVAGVKLPDVLADPYGAANAAGQLLIDSHPLPRGIKPRRTPEVVKHARMRLIEAISEYPEKPLISFAAFAQSLGVSKGFLSYREPVLCKVYKEEYATQVRQANKNRKRQAKAELTLGRAFLRYLGGEFRSQDELVDYLHTNFGVKKHVARLLVSEVLKTHLRIKALSEMSGLRSSQRTMLLRGRAAGYL